MLVSSAGMKIYLALGSTDMRKSINGLTILVSEQLELDPFSGHLFVFCNRRQNMLKILYWEKNGFCLWHKRLEKHSFHWPSSKEDILPIEWRELSWLIEGLDISEVSGHSSLKYSTIF